jgi:uncharacterized protein
MARRFPIPLARLQPGATRFSGDVEFEVLDAAAESQDFAGRLECAADNLGPRIHLKGGFRGTAQSHCHRCLEAFNRQVEGAFDVILDRSARDLGDEVIVIAEELEEYDIVPLAREAMIVEEPLQLRCRPDCRGLCAQCGTNLNEGACACQRQQDPRWDALRDLGRKLDSGSGS